MSAHPNPRDFFPRVVTFAGHLIAIERHHVDSRAELLRKWNPRHTDVDWLDRAYREAADGDVQHWTFLHPAIEAAWLEANAMVEERSSPPNYDAAMELRRQATKLMKQLEEA